jgi:hypothetical protein
MANTVLDHRPRTRRKPLDRFSNVLDARLIAMFLVLRTSVVPQIGPNCLVCNEVRLEFVDIDPFLTESITRLATLATADVVTGQ